MQELTTRSFSTATFIMLFDAVASMYSNFPRRWSHAELLMDIPCKEKTFASNHPFVDDELIFTPRETWHKSYSSLFEDSKPAALAPGLTVIHLFILIHRESLSCRGPHYCLASRHLSLTNFLQCSTSTWSPAPGCCSRAIQDLRHKTRQRHKALQYLMPVLCQRTGHVR